MNVRSTFCSQHDMIPRIISKSRMGFFWIGKAGVQQGRKTGNNSLFTAIPEDKFFPSRFLEKKKTMEHVLLFTWEEILLQPPIYDELICCIYLKKVHNSAEKMLDFISLFFTWILRETQVTKEVDENLIFSGILA